MLRAGLQEERMSVVFVKSLCRNQMALVKLATTAVRIEYISDLSLSGKNESRYRRKTSRFLGFDEG